MHQAEREGRAQKSKPRGTPEVHASEVGRDQSPEQKASDILYCKYWSARCGSDAPEEPGITWSGVTGGGQRFARQAGSAVRTSRRLVLEARYRYSHSNEYEG